MYGLIGKMTCKPGQRDALLPLLLQGAKDMPGCLSYIIAKDTADQDAVWITEVWEDEASHHDSLQLPSVRDTIAKAMPLIAGFEPGVITDPVGGVGLTYRKGLGDQGGELEGGT
jgi:quinol monooxygenase YgiN